MVLLVNGCFQNTPYLHMLLGMPVLSLGTEKESDFIVASGLFSLGMEVEEEHAVLLTLHLFLPI